MIICNIGLHHYVHVWKDDPYEEHKQICSRCKKLKKCKRCGSTNIELSCGLGDYWETCLTCKSNDAKIHRNLTEQAFGKENRDENSKRYVKID